MSGEIIDCPSAEYCRTSLIFKDCVDCTCNAPRFKITVGCKNCQRCIDERTENESENE